MDKSDYFSADVDVFYKFRYTFPKQDQLTIYDPSRNPTILDKKMFHKINETIHKYSTQLTTGFESKNSKGEPTYYHMHTHFKTRVIKDTVLKAIKRLLIDYNYPSKGVKVISLKPEVFVNEAKFFNYPLKQYSSDLSIEHPVAKLSQGFTISQLNTMRATAYDTWCVSVQIMSKKTGQNTELDSVFSRAVSRCTEYPMDNKSSQMETKKVSTLRDVQRVLIQLYKEEEKPINITTIKGYSLTIGLKLNIIDEDYILDAMN